MATNLGIDDDLLAEAQKVSGHKTKKATVNAALEAYIRQHQREKAIEMFGTVDWDPDYDYKRERNRKRGGADG